MKFLEDFALKLLPLPSTTLKKREQATEKKEIKIKFYTHGRVRHFADIFHHTEQTIIFADFYFSLIPQQWNKISH